MLLLRQHDPGQARFLFIQLSLISGFSVTIHSIAPGFLVPPVLYITVSLAHTLAKTCRLSLSEVSKKSLEKVFSSSFFIIGYALKCSTARDPPDSHGVPLAGRTTSNGDKGDEVGEAEDLVNGNLFSFY